MSVAKQSAESVAAGIQHPQKEQSYQRALAVELAIRGYLTSLEHPAPVLYKASNGCATVLGHERADLLVTHGKLQWSFIIEVKRGGSTNLRAAKDQATRYCKNLTVAGHPQLIAGIVVVFADKEPRTELAWTFA